MSSEDEKEALIKWLNKHLEKRKRREEAFTRLMAPIRNSFISNEDERKVLISFRSFYKWFFDFLKNALAVAAIGYLAKKTGSSFVYWIYYISSGVLVTYCFTYVDSWIFQPIWWPNRLKWTVAANLIVSFIVTTTLYFSIQFGLNGAISKMVDLQGMK